MKPSKLLDAAERARIEEAVREAERGTSAEIVVAVVHACDEYGSAGWRLAVALAALSLLGIGLFAPPQPIALHLAAQALALGLGHALARFDPIRRSLISERLLALRAEQRAWSAFAEQGLRFTSERTGILIFVALFEHRVVVRADRGVHQALGPNETWEEVVDLVLGGVRRGALADGLLAAVRRCGEILSHPLPPRPSNPDELPGGLILED